MKAKQSNLSTSCFYEFVNTIKVFPHQFTVVPKKDGGSNSLNVNPKSNIITEPLLKDKNKHINYYFFPPLIQRRLLFT